MTNLKALMERREELRQNMETLVNTADTECRAMTEEETAQFDAAESEIRAIDATIEREERTRGVSNLPAPTDAEERAAAEESAFVDYVMGRVSELRAGEQNLTMANNGAIIPTSIADRIVTAVRDRCPILSGATIYRVNGTLKVPVWGKANTTHDIAVGYQTEFTELTADSGKFTSVDLSGYLAGALTLIGNSVENNSVFNVTDFIINQMAEEIALFLEKELLNGTSGKATGALSTPTAVTAASATAITADELIELQAQVKQVYQANACWTMAPETFTSLKKLKDSNGRYLLLTMDGTAGTVCSASRCICPTICRNWRQAQALCCTAITAACRLTCVRTSRFRCCARSMRPSTLSALSHGSSSTVR